MEQVFNVSVFLLFAVLWAAFAVALVASQGSLDEAWRWMQGQHIVIQGVVALLLLPLVAGLWVWETSWPLVVRLLVVGGLAWANLFAFLPKGIVGFKP